jgi:hypothetical protein
MAKQISDPSRPTATEIQSNDYFVLDRGENGVTYRVPAPLIARPYKVISGLISQVATDDPTAIILENNTGATPTFTRLDIGVYAITATGLFEEDKTWCIISESDANIERNSDNQVRIFGVDDLLLNTSFEIRIYP